MNEQNDITDLQNYVKHLIPKGSKKILLIIALFMGLIVIPKSITIIPAGHVGLQDFFGNVSDKTLSAGLHFINPLLKIHKMTIRTQEVTEQANVPSKEGLSVHLDVSLLASLNPEKAARVYKTIGSEYIRVVVIPQLRSVIRGVTASYEAKALYTSEREAIANEMFSHLQGPLLERGVTVEKVLLRSATLPSILATAIEKKLEAEQQSEQMKFVLNKETQEADRKRIEAQGIADFQKIVTTGLTDLFLRWKGIEATSKLADSENSKVVVIGSGKDGLPIILGGQ
ncbi:MAG: membrane protease subunit, stomatin/prohibitin [Deltaproteobacteria bacterium RIFCSPLOWO2_12_FULL_40_28]|nr:MAG: membrane protease subunit, stomatin/prohibitin [Deltaproteobacteria bacterium RIFCSPHIGHO2_02_FULL_40_28]OGQ19781.1 MAG: membrane protease subunit, stomatin/prohibitin [Deltaproteobacteria bacterium RIFCSPHIGHO2_12_FULL_40_32]OGQ41058.1 MAG: membrane protease subunit, stomatin/prohibitin [Deltaproteobacteria bacterium RIFCSPLOWO2_02_FULL_40_36]OGQ54174.1 MAG: membrane protease subunit, stomatin/prohibitin [Deltaproteobacteria bacterium RIFCSPLOWO2_12_FULL_40_28]